MISLSSLKIAVASAESSRSRVRTGGSTMKPVLYYTLRCTHCLEDSLRFAHCALNRERLDVLPVLLEEGDEEVNGENGVGGDFGLGHVDVSDGDRHAKHLLQLELDGRLDIEDLSGHVVASSEQSRELAGLVQTGTKNTGLRRADTER